MKILLNSLSICYYFIMNIFLNFQYYVLHGTNTVSYTHLTLPT